MEDKKMKSSSFPSNYVTLVQLQERWLKEKERKQREKEGEDRRQKQKKPEGEGSEARKVEHELRLRRKDSPEASAAEVDVAEGADRQEKRTAKKKKRRSERKWKIRRELNPAAEDEVSGKEAVEEPPLLTLEEDTVGGDTRAEFRAGSGGLDRTVGFETDSRASSSNRGIGKTNYGFGKGGARRNHERRTSGSDARAASDNLDEKTDSGMKNGFLSENVVISEQYDGLSRRNGDGVKEEMPARRSRGNRRNRGGIRAERNGVDPLVTVESQFRALSVNDETVKKDNGRNRGKGERTSGETGAESESLDAAAEIEPELRGFLVGETVKKNNGRKKSGKGKRTSCETRAENESLYLAAEVVPEVIVNGDTVKKNDGRKTGKSKRTSSQARAESESLDLVAEIEPEIRGLHVNGDTVKKNNGRKSGKSKRTSGEAGAESSSLDLAAEIEPEIRGLLVNGKTVKKKGGWKSGRSKKASGQTRVESESLDLAPDVEPELRALPVIGETAEGNEELRRRDNKKQDGPVRESRKTGNETKQESNELDQLASIETKVSALPVNGWVRKGNDGSRRKGFPVRRNDGNRRGGGAETMLESPNLDQMADTKPKFRPSSVAGETEEGNGGVTTNCVKEESRGTGVDSTWEGNSLNQTNDLKLETGTFCVKGRAAGNGSGCSQTSSGQSWGYRKSERSSQREVLNRKDSGAVWMKIKMADIEPEVRALSVTGETEEGNVAVRSNGAEEEGVEAIAEGNSSNQTNDIKPEIITPSVNGESCSWTSAGYNHGYRESRRSTYGSFRQREALKGKDSGLVWVKKG